MQWIWKEAVLNHHENVEYKLLQCNPSLSVNYEESDLPFDTLPLMKIPVYQYVRAGGKAMVLRETTTDYIVTKKSCDDSLFAVVVKGNSMYPEISEGDMV